MLQEECGAGVSASLRIYIYICVYVYMSLSKRVGSSLTRCSAASHGSLNRPAPRPLLLLSAFLERLSVRRVEGGGHRNSRSIFSRRSYDRVYKHVFYDGRMWRARMFLGKSGNLSQAGNRIIMSLPDLEKVLVFLLMSALAR